MVSIRTRGRWGCALRQDSAGRLEAVQPRHPDVHQDDVGPAASRGLDRVDAVLRLADDAKVGCASRIIRNPVRTSVWSSAIRIADASCRRRPPRRKPARITGPPVVATSSCPSYSATRSTDRSASRSGSRRCRVCRDLELEAARQRATITSARCRHPRPRRCSARPRSPGRPTRSTPGVRRSDRLGAQLTGEPPPLDRGRELRELLKAGLRGRARGGRRRAGAHRAGGASRRASRGRSARR